MSPATLLWLIAGCLMLQPLSTDLYVPSLPHLAIYFSASAAAVQQTLSAFVIGFAIAQLLSGPLSDRFGRRPILLAGLFVYLLATVACGLAADLELLVLSRFAQAMGGCTAVVVARAIIRDAYTPLEGAKVIAQASSMLAIAPLCGPVAGGYLQVMFGWRAAFALMAAFAVALSAAIFFRLAETNARRDPEAIRPALLVRNYLAISRNPTFWSFALFGGLSYANIFVFISGSSIILIGVLGVATEYYGWLFAFGVTGYLAGTIVCRQLLGAIGLEKTVRLGASVAFLAGLGALLAAYAGVHHWSLLVGAQFFAMLAHGINFPCAQSGAIAPFPERAGSAAGLFGFCSMMGALLAGTWVGGTHDGTVYPLLEISVVIGTLLATSTVLLARYRTMPAAVS